DVNVAFALTSRAAAAIDVEAEMAGSVVVRASFDRFREHLADWIERLDIGHRIGAGRPANCRLIDEHHVINLSGPDEIIEGKRLFAILAFPATHGAMQRL